MALLKEFSPTVPFAVDVKETSQVVQFAADRRSIVRVVVQTLAAVWRM
jgi:hypothetical protein